MVEVLLGVLVGVAVGGAIGWLWAHARARSAAVDMEARARAAEVLSADRQQQVDALHRDLERVRAELQAAVNARVEADTRIEGVQQAFEEKRRLLDEAQAKLTDTFKALSADALKSNSDSFLQRAGESLEARQKSIDQLVKPMGDALSNLNAEVQAMKQTVGERLGQDLRALTERTSSLATALRDPKVRGQWGEMTLQRVAELAGLSEHCVVEQQVTSQTEEGARLRPDMVVHLPGERDVVVDAKAVLAAYLDALEAPVEEDRQRKLQEHARHIRERVRALATKDYARQFASPPEFVILFLPGESFFSAALSVDRRLMEDAIRQGVFIATPTTLVALLRAVHHGWQQRQAAENAKRIVDLGCELHERMAKLAEHFSAVGGALEAGVKAYNGAVGTLETRVLPSARRFKDLGADSGKEVQKPASVDERPRPLTAPELVSPPSRKSLPSLEREVS